MDMHERLKKLIETLTTPTRRYKELEDITNIASGTWKTYLTRGVRPSAELVEAIAQAWPQYAFWLATGQEDSEFGHVSPKSILNNTEESEATNDFFSELFKRNRNSSTLNWRESKNLEHGLNILKEHNLIESTESDMSTENWRVQFYSEIRMIEFILDICIPKLSADSAIAVFNESRKMANLLNAEAADEKQKHAIGKLDKKFIIQKERIEQIVKWANSK